MIYCVWYPSGGFGHFINAVLTLHGVGFIRPKNQLTFSKNGNSHNLEKIAPKYRDDRWPDHVEFLHDKNYCVLIDNGINDENEKFKFKFTDATVVKICYNDFSWPVVARTMIDKAMGSNIEEQLPLDHWNSNEPWARREKYFLFLRDHNFRHAWKPTNECIVYINDLFDYTQLFDTVNSFAEVQPFQELWYQWREANAKYIDPIEVANIVVSHVSANQSYDITHVNDIWTQSVIYYYIWLKFGIEISHNDFANFFSNTKEIAELVL